jgi:putative aminopeptidase FrvX
VERERLLAELFRAAEKLGIEVRIEPFDTGGTSAGGICKLRGKRVVLIDASASVAEQASALAEVLSNLDHERVYLTPGARDYIYKEKARRLRTAR